MISRKTFFAWITPVQRQSFVISLSATVMMLLLLSLAGLITLISFRGAVYFWPSQVYEVQFREEPHSKMQPFFAKITDSYTVEDSLLVQLHYASAQHPFGSSLIIATTELADASLPTDVAEILLMDGRQIFARLLSIDTPHGVSQKVDATSQQEVAALRAEIAQIHNRYLAPLHERLAELDRRQVSLDAPLRQRLMQDFTQWKAHLASYYEELNSYTLNLAFADGTHYPIALADVARWHFPNQQTWMEKSYQAFIHIGDFLTQQPKQGNTTGGVFPALFGTILMVLLMTLMVTPVGVMTAIYLHEYAPNNWFTSTLRIAVANMAGVPSIVYGVFGLGFFVYVLGGSIDELFFAERLPSPTMGSPGLFWASLTMAILTLPVVIVSTEEGLRRVPSILRAGSYALGATKYETLRYTVLPMASPGIMTGVILAIARAAGEVAPLMLVGAVKFAPALPIDGEFPYFHIDRQFMHLGVLIYDGAFHSQVGTTGSSLVFATCMLLLLVVCLLNICAVMLRNHLYKRYLRGT